MLPKERLVKEGQRGLRILDWNNIIPEYEKVFSL